MPGRARVRDGDVHVKRAVSLAAAVAMVATLAPTRALASGPAQGAAAPEIVDRDSSRPATRARVGILPLVIAGDESPEIGDALDRLSMRVFEAFSGDNYDAVLLKADAAGDAKNPYCADAVCWQMFADEHRVTHFLVVVVDYRAPDYAIDARLFDGRTGDKVASRDTDCDLCGITEIAERVQDVSAAMRREVEATIVLPPRLVVDSVPAGASVWLDGERIGATPMQTTAIAGAHLLEVKHPDYVTDKIQLDLIDGVRREVVAKLRKLPPEPVKTPVDTGSDRKATAFIAAGAAGIAVGAGLLAGGGAMIAIDGDPIERDCNGDNVDALGRCRFLHQTQGAGIGLAVAGAAVLAAGVTLTILGVRRKNKSKKTANVSVAGLGLVGRF